ncbi:MAG: DNA-directed RNA polymerase subunit alpha [Candidatus Portnoybacteria bacterium]|nr:DNA-directed RNA polymerase subunit alpha [Candidatus Portnoybacteria bacterium]
MEKNKIPLPQKPKITKKEENRAIIKIDGCYPGYGLTLANALRRVLLSSLPGVAITAIKIKGVSHEFAGIPNVLENVIKVILNLKNVRFKINSLEALPMKLELKAKGKGEVKAKEIKTPSEVEVVNKDAYIATITDSKGKLEIEIEIDSGLGHISAEARKKKKLEIGAIATDAIFTPIKKINYEVENMRVGDRTDFNRVVLDVETDGSITPEEAFNKSVGTILEQFGILQTEKKETKTKKPTKKSTTKKKSTKKKSTSKKKK